MIKHVPNILTFGRLVLSAIFIVMVLVSPQIQQDKWLYLDVAFVLFLIAAFTDLADGHIARKYNVTSKIGRIVDPLADKVLICGAFAAFAIIGQPKLFSLSDTTLSIIHWAFLGVVIAREAAVTIIRHVMESKGVSFPATFSGKFKMLCQAFAVGTVMVKMAHVQTAAWGYWFTSVVYIIVVIMTIWSGILYVKKIIPSKSTL